MPPESRLEKSRQVWGRGGVSGWGRCGPSGPGPPGVGFQGSLWAGRPGGQPPGDTPSATLVGWIEALEGLGSNALCDKPSLTPLEQGVHILGVHAHRLWSTSCPSESSAARGRVHSLIRSHRLAELQGCRSTGQTTRGQDAGSSQGAASLGVPLGPENPRALSRQSFPLSVSVVI